MSRLAGRIRLLEHRLGGCPTCRGRTRVIELYGPNGPWPGHHADTSPCPDCGQPCEVVRLVLAFDHAAFPDGDRDTNNASPGSVQWEREQHAKHAQAGDG